jgi:broad specificity phosphatase PhoE
MQLVVERFRMEIMLLRHGRPITPPLNKLSASAFHGWVREYDASGLSPSSVPGEQVLSYAEGCNAFVCSALPRSIESVKALGVEDVMLSDALFNEAGLPGADWPVLTLSPMVWAVVFRVLWLGGYSRYSESFSDAKKRAAEAAERLTALAREHQRVLFVGHGVFNHILAGELRRGGWAGPKRPGSKHWGFGVYLRGKI